MEVFVNGRTVEIRNDGNIVDALAAARINPETVLVKRKGALVPHDEPLKNGDRLDLITVISGG